MDDLGKLSDEDLLMYLGRDFVDMGITSVLQH